MNKYNLPHQWIAAPRIGELVPIFMQQVIPGDIFQGRSTGVFRLAPLDVPTYMTLNIHARFFFVPYRVIDEDFEDWVTGNNPSGVPPTFTYNLVTHWEMLKHFGIPASTQAVPISSYPVRAYNHIWNEFFRDADTLAEVPLDNIGVRRVSFPESSYFGKFQTNLQQTGAVTVDTSQPTLAVNTIRDAMRKQKLRERRAMFGDSYREMLMSDFGIRTPDSRLQRAEYLCHGKATMGISEVVATATSASENTGEYRGHGITGMTVRFPRRRFIEHGMIMGVMYARPRLQIKSKFDRLWLCTDKTHYYDVSEVDKMVTVNNREVYHEGSGSNYAYIPNYQWLREAVDVIAGPMQGAAYDNFTATVDMSSGLPPLSYLKQVQDYDNLFQDQTSSRADILTMFDHKISKHSRLPRHKIIAGIVR